MGGEKNCSRADLQNWLFTLGFGAPTHDNIGSTYYRGADDTCLIIDTTICHLSDYSYVAYTCHQNELMAGHARVFRFLFDTETSVDTLQQGIKTFLDEEGDPEQIRCFGANRSEQEPDPTFPEAAFEDCFLEAFGGQARMGLHREFAYIDLEGTTRYIDYALFGRSAKFAIELNGESFHHPAVIGARKYRSQTFQTELLDRGRFQSLPLVHERYARSGTFHP